MNPIVTYVFKLTVCFNGFLLAGKPHRLDIFHQSVISLGSDCVMTKMFTYFNLQTNLIKQESDFERPLSGNLNSLATRSLQ